MTDSLSQSRREEAAVKSIHSALNQLCDALDDVHDRHTTRTLTPPLNHRVAYEELTELLLHVAGIGVVPEGASEDHG